MVAYRFEDLQTRGTVAYAPAVEHWTADLSGELDGAGAFFLGGTFWTEEELIVTGVGTLTARQMGHLPISGPEGSHRAA